VVIDLAVEQGLQVSERRVQPAELYAADEVFITSTVRELVPVVRVDDTRIAAGQPGPVSLALLRAYRERAQRG
jgi:branched-subunit amino acid aminotransferase/4-amino-4-deoxychorismate lyase